MPIMICLPDCLRLAFIASGLPTMTMSALGVEKKKTNKDNLLMLI